MIAVERRLSELIPDTDEISRAARYSLLAGGKRLRPHLVIAAAEAFGADPSVALDPACALEMIHTYSLIHDDLPCMDNDDFRRGKPTSHKVFGEGMAVLAGDYLLTYAFEVLARAPLLTAEQRIALVLSLSKRAGGDGMIKGQADDIQSAGKTIGEEKLLEMHRGKTAALFIACFEFAAIIAKEDPSGCQAIGGELGLAYQFHNDLVDATADFATLGKTAGGDAVLNKPTAVSLYGIENTRRKIDQHMESILRRLSRWPGNGARLFSLIEKILQRNR